MPTLTDRLPDDTHERLKELARHRGVSVNKLVDELSTIAVTQHDAETRFRALAARGSVKEGLRLLDKLDGALGGSRAVRWADSSPSSRPRPSVGCLRSVLGSHSRFSVLVADLLSAGRWLDPCMAYH